MTTLSPAASAPDFTLLDQNENPVSLSQFRGKKVILFFYPSAMTPGCTKEACDFRDNTTRFENAGYVILGISKDNTARQRKFAERDSLPYPLLSDESLEVHKAYGAYGEKKLYGKTVEGVIRTTAVVDEQGAIEHLLHNVKATGHVERLARLLKLAE